MVALEFDRFASRNVVGLVSLSDVVEEVGIAG
jgi:hypothetical protein